MAFFTFSKNSPKVARIRGYQDGFIIKEKLIKEKLDFNLKFMLTFKRTNEVDELLSKGLASVAIRLRYCSTN